MLTACFRLIAFAFHHGDANVNAGMLLPLLSLCLATLMALFRDPETAPAVSPEELTLLIRETGTSLLDSRLSSPDGLSEETGSQMVRAINKVTFPCAAQRRLLRYDHSIPPYLRIL